ncbi:MAG: phytanoyl-CoA dioxygenase family protein [Candidatus Poribacteria bacterium]|nr:phytanoyl-CoA dioxygenase family protein [Candidatus Poribacteria bacterium]
MTPEQDRWKAQFERDGYLIIPNLFPRQEATRLKAECLRILNSLGNPSEGILKTGVYVGLAANSEVFAEAVADSRLLDVLEATLGEEIEFLSDKFVFKNDSTGFGSPWHQDWHYWHGSNKHSIWVALDDVTTDNGALKVMPGSHLAPITHDGDASDGHGFGHRMRPDAVDESKAVTGEMEAGGAIFFSDLTLHSSHPNTTGADRWVWIPTYRDASADDPDYKWAVARKIVR